MRGCQKRWTQRIVWGSPNAYGFEAACDRHRRVFDAALTVCSRYVHQRFDPTSSWSRPTTATEFSPTVSRTPAERFNPGPCFQPLGAVAGRAAGLALLCPLVQSPGSPRCLEVEPVSGTVRGQRAAPDHRPPLGTPTSPERERRSVVGPDRCHRFRGRLFRAQKKRTGAYSAQRAALGGRTLKCGQSRFFVGYKKHTFRLWLRAYQPGVLLVPLVSWAAPANHGEGGFLQPSVIYCQRRWQWYPNMIVADMGYIDAGTKQQLRERLQITVVTKLKENMRLVPPLKAASGRCASRASRCSGWATRLRTNSIGSG
jgi:hypothetical protein